MSYNKYLKYKNKYNNLKNNMFGGSMVSANTGSVNMGSVNMGSANMGSANTGSANTGSANTGSANTGSFSGNLERTLDEKKQSLATMKKEALKLYNMPFNDENRRQYNQMYCRIINLTEEITQSNMRPILPIMELYQFEINGYTPDNTVYSFGKLRTSVLDECGIIKTIKNDEQHNYDYNNLYSSCDSLNSKIQLGGDLNINDLTMKDFYSAYLNNKAKRGQPEENMLFTDEFKEQFKNNMETLYNYNMEYIKKNMGETRITKEQTDTLLSLGFVFRITVPKEKKIIIMGDIHGSLHTFLRNMFRLIQLNILDINFKLNENYIIIFLGDVLDRGTYALEILSFIFNLMIVNNKEELNIIFNRGNHEEISIWNIYGFKNEIDKKMPILNEKKNVDLQIRFFSSLSSAIILSVDINGIEHSFWLSHGGIPYCSKTLKPLIIGSSKVILYDKDIADQIRWNDFSYIPNVEVNGPRRGIGYIINDKALSEFLKVNNINYVIRGHQDSKANSYLFSNKEHYIISEKTNISSEVVIINPNVIHQLEEEATTPVVDMEHKDSNAPVINSQRNSKNGPIARIVLCVNKDGTQINRNTILYPMLTLSTNTDLSRGLVHDSFGVLRFDLKTDEFDTFNSIKSIYDIQTKLFKLF
jgi:hypothetical protein